MSRCKGIKRERKSISSVTGPATKLRHPIQLLSVSCNSVPLVHSRQPDSMMALSNRGPANRSAVRSETLDTASKLIGYQPNWRKDVKMSRWPRFERMIVVRIEQRATDALTKRIRALITDGASRLRVGEGLVVGER